MAWKTKDVIRLIDFVIKRSGYISNGKAKEKNSVSTAGYIKLMLIKCDSHEARNTLHDFESLGKKEIEEQEKTLQPIINWISSIDQDNPDLFLRKLKVVAQQDEVGESDLPVLTSLFSSYVRHLESSSLIGSSASKYVGEVGEKINLELKLIYQKEISSQWGPSVIYSFKDINGNELTWFTKGLDLRNGITYNVVGTVKSHQTFRGTKQTVLTRCKVQTSDA